ncbi:hypothetical protein BGW41_006079, partial [Actinomortierella wolfii]
MAKDGFLTPKAIANRIKAKGLQKLRWYCQVCEKQCRDENGFKCHLESESHQRRILLVAESPEKYINSYSAEFQSEFMKLLSTRYGTRRVQANHVYQEYISDRQHLHMNATKWTTLTEFVKHLGKEGLAIVDETPKGWFIQWIDRSPKALARQEAIAKKERMELDDEQREQKMIQEQMARAAAAQQTKTEADKPDDSPKELVRENEEEKIKLNLSLKPAAGSTTTKSGGGLLGSGSLLKPKSLNALATKKPNPLKSASASASSKSALPSSLTSTTSSAQSETTSTSTTSSAIFSSETRKRTAAEENVDQEVARKRRFTSSEETAMMITVGNETGLETMNVIVIDAVMTIAIGQEITGMTERSIGIEPMTRKDMIEIDAEMMIATATETVIETATETTIGSGIAIVTAAGTMTDIAKEIEEI